MQNFTNTDKNMAILRYDQDISVQHLHAPNHRQKKNRFRPFIIATAIVPLFIIPLFLFFFSAGKSTLQTTQSTQYILINTYSNVTPFTITIDGAQQFQFQTKYGVIKLTSPQSTYFITFSASGYATVSCYLVASPSNAPNICRIKQIDASQDNKELDVYFYASYGLAAPTTYTRAAQQNKRSAVIV